MKFINKNFPLVIGIALGLLSLSGVHQTLRAAEWLSNDRDRLGTRHNPDEDILDKSNIAQISELKQFQATGSIIKNAAVADDAIYFTSLKAEALNDLNNDGDIQGFRQSPSGPLPQNFDDHSSYVYKLDKNLNPVPGWPTNHVNIATAFSQCHPGQPVPPLLIQTSPTVKGNKVIVATSQLNFPIIPIGLPSGYLIALDKNDGHCLWATLITEEPPPTEVACSPDGSDPSLPFCGLAGFPFIAPPVIEAGSQPNTLKYHHVAEGVQSSPVVDGNFMYVATTSAEEEFSAFVPGFPCCKTNPKVAKVDLNTGHIVWQKKLIDSSILPSDPNDHQRFAGVTVYSSPAVVLDHKNKMIYVATGDAYRGDPDYCYTGDPREECVGNSRPKVSDIDPKKLPINSLIAIDMEGAHEIKWVLQAVPDDFWTFACVPLPGVGNQDANCPNPPGPNYNISGGPLLIRNVINYDGIDAYSDGKPDQHIDIVVGKVKDGNVIAAEVTTGAQVWKKRVGAPVLIGLSGLAYDGQQIFVTSEGTPHIDFQTGFPTSREWTMQGAGPYGGSKIYGGCVSALDPATGTINWQSNAIQQIGAPYYGLPGGGIPMPTLDDLGGGAMHLFSLDSYLGPPSSIPGVVFAESIAPSNELHLLFGLLPPITSALLPPAPNMYAFDSETGNVLWHTTVTNPHQTFGENFPGAVISGATIVDGRVYWGTGFVESDGIMHVFGLPH